MQSSSMSTSPPADQIINGNIMPLIAILSIDGFVLSHSATCATVPIVVLSKLYMPTSGCGHPSPGKMEGEGDPALTRKKKSARASRLAAAVPAPSWVIRGAYALRRAEAVRSTKNSTTRIITCEKFCQIQQQSGQTQPKHLQILANVF